MERIGGEQEGRRTSLGQVISASVVGTIIEWYDFALYGAAAALVFNQLFFPDVDPLLGTLAALATYGVGFFARPLGGIIFGNYGDKLGRKTILVITLLLMGIATTLVGVLPTFDQVGLLAPILLVALRILQGLGAGAEFGGAVIMAVEYSPRERRGFYASLPCLGVAIGIALASGVFGLFALLPEEQFLAWGWRVPFLLSVLVVAVGLYIRFRVLETPVFAEVKEADAQVRRPVVEVVRSQPKTLLIAIGARVAEVGGSTIFQVFVLTYIAQLGVSESVGLTGVLLASGLGLFTIPFFGALSDRVGRRPVYLFGAAFMTLFAFPYFWLLDTGTTALIWLAICLSYGVGTFAMFSPQASFFAELFDARVRYSGIALAREVSAPFTGGISPFVSAALLYWAGGEPWPVAIYLMVMGIITVVAVYLAPETYRSDISKDRLETGEEPREASPA